MMNFQSRMIEEIETKLDIPLAMPLEDFMENVKALLGREQWEINKERLVNRHYTYYDTETMCLHNNGETLRRVEGSWSSKGTFRYDHKIRHEGRVFESEPHWTDGPQNIETLKNLFELAHISSPLKAVAAAKTQHHKMMITQSDTSIEVALDIFDLGNNIGFTELECELKLGSQSALKEITHIIARHFNLSPPPLPQKYFRVISLVSTHQSNAQFVPSLLTFQSA